MKRRALVVLAASLVLAACGRDGGAGGSATTADLRIEVRDAPAAAPRSATLSCHDNAGTGTGFLADEADAACETIVESPPHAALIAQGPPGDRTCTMVFGGPQVARVTGRLGGKIVDRIFKRTNGCEIADWESLEALLGKPEGGPGVPM